MAEQDGSLRISEQPPNPVPHAGGNHVVLPGQAPDGQYVLSVLLKRTYRFADRTRCVRAEKDRKIVTGDQHYQDPMNSSVRLESDFVPFKLATDVALNGRAYAPPGRPAQELVATLAVGDYHKDVLVIGDRTAQYRPQRDPAFTEPAPFESVDIRYESAFGGVDIYFDRKMACMYGRNHLGKGYVIANSKESVDGLPLPNIEDPDDRLTSERLCIGHHVHWERQPMPRGFGWFGKYWRPRCLLAGVLPADRKYEAELRAAHTQLVPADQLEMYEQTRLPDMDFRFFNGASPGLALPFLSGDEMIRTQHLSPEGSIAFQLPGDHPRLGLDLGSGVQEPTVVLHTVMIHMDERELDLVWRGAVPYEGPDSLPALRRMEVLVQ